MTKALPLDTSDATRVEPSASFEVDGKVYTVTFRIGQQKAFQREMGEPVVSALVAMETSPGDMLRLSALFRHGLTPAVAEEDAVDALIDRIGLKKALRVITAASTEAFKDLTDPPTDPPAK